MIRENPSRLDILLVQGSSSVEARQERPEQAKASNVMASRRCLDSITRVNTAPFSHLAHVFFWPSLPHQGNIIFRIDLQASVAGMPRTAATGSFLPLIRHLSDCHTRINPTFFLLLPSSCPPPVTTREYSPIAIIRLSPFSSNFSSELT